jgi:hypothetical protein
MSCEHKKVRPLRWLPGATCRGCGAYVERRWVAVPLTGREAQAQSDYLALQHAKENP